MANSGRSAARASASSGEGCLGKVRPDLDDLGCPGDVHGEERGRLGRRGDVERALDDGERRLDAVDVAVGAGKVQRRDGAGELVRSDADVRSGFVLGPILLGAEPRASYAEAKSPMASASVRRTTTRA